MVPLMMEEGYRADGWLGMLLGTRLWYAFYGTDSDDVVGFERRVDALVREIGDQGKAMAGNGSVPPPATAPKSAAAARSAPPEAVPPASSAPETPRMRGTTAGTARADAALSLAYTPSVQAPWPSDADHEGVMAPLGVSSAGGSFTAITAFIDQQQDKLLATLREERSSIRSEMESQFVQQREEISALKQLLDGSKRIHLARDAVTSEQLEAVQARLQALHVAQLLTEQELAKAEDAIADAVELMGVTPELPANDSCVGAVLKLVALSDGMVGDVSFARQLRRKFV